jgi:apolipoprotein N-acyltransferase
MIARLSPLASRWPSLIAVALGGVSATGFAPLGLWPLLLLCLAVFMALVRGLPSRGAALRAGWCFGFGHFAVGLSWMAHAFTYQDAMPVWLGWFASPFLALPLAVYPAVATGLAWRWGRGNATLFALYFAASWIVTEWLRATLFTGLPWNPLASAFVDVAGITRLVGTYGASGIVILAAAGLSLALSRRWASALGLLALPLFALVYGFAEIPGPDDRPAKATLLIVQPNIGQQDKYRADYATENFAKLAALTVDRKARGPRVIFWPEAAVPDMIGQGDAASLFARERLVSLLQPGDILLTGADLIYEQKTPRGEATETRWIGAANSSFTLDSQGRILWRYDKAHLVPFGEYVPLRALFTPLGIARLVPGDLDFWPGKGPHTDTIPGLGTVGTQICYEIIFSGQVVDRAHRPDFLFNPSNDAWYGAWEPAQHLAQARLRAVEEGLPVIRSTPTGISAVIDAEGRIVSALPLNRPGVLRATLPPAHEPTLFARFGNRLPLLFALMLALIGIALRPRLR